MDGEFSKLHGGASDMTDSADFIDVKTLMATYSFEEHALLADQYFRMYDVDSPILRKPFVNISQAEDLLPKLSRVLKAAQLFPGARVCDFGAGTAWLTRILCEIGCEAAALDISMRALELGRSHMARVAPERAEAARFLHYDGHRIPVEDRSFDRIIAFDSFHHVPNQEAVLAEMARVLDDHGFAVFNEPGPLHSRAPASQMEMRHHKVIENDIVIEEIWETAQKVGFERLELDMFPPESLKLKLEDFQLFSSWETAEPLLKKHFVHYQNVWRNHRLFTLYKNAQLRFDSRHRASLRGKISAGFVQKDGLLVLDVEVTNTGASVWRNMPGAGQVNLGVAARYKDGRFNRNFVRFQVAQEPTAPKVTRFLHNLKIQGLEQISELEIDLVSEHVAWFEELAPTCVKLKIPNV
jgi:SAM-dependent methyltransferase